MEKQVETLIEVNNAQLALFNEKIGFVDLVYFFKLLNAMSKYNETIEKEGL